MGYYTEDNPNTFEKQYGMNMPEVVIACGIPTAGKTTWINKVLIPKGFVSISRDDIRLSIYKKYDKIKFDSVSEKIITNLFDTKMKKCIEARKSIVLDNTHCKKTYIDAVIQRFEGTGYKIYVVFFDIPIWKAYFRNWKRNLIEGKNIPKDVMKQMLSNYKKINQNDYISYRWQT